MSLFKKCAHRGRAVDSCEHPWHATVTHHRQRHRVSLEAYFRRRVRGRGSKTLARDLDAQFAVDVVEGRYVARKAQIAALAIPRQGLTFRAFIPVYKRQYVDRKKLKSWDEDRKWKLGKLARMGWGPMLLDQITMVQIDAALDALRAEGSGAATVRRYWALIRQMLTWAAAKGYLAKSPIPDAGIDLESEDGERDRRLTEDEEALLFAHADPYLADCLTVALGTTLRQRSMLAIQVQHIDWTRGAERPGRLRHQGLIKLPGRLLKQKRKIVIPMTLAVREVIERRVEAIRAMHDIERDDPQWHVLGNELGEGYKSDTAINKRWYACLASAGLKRPADPVKGIAAVDVDLEWRDLRAEGASRLAEMGTPIDTIRRLLGHATLAMTTRYLRARVAELDALVEASESWVPQMDSRRSLTPKITPLAPKGAREEAS